MHAQQHPPTAAAPATRTSLDDLTATIATAATATLSAAHRSGDDDRLDAAAALLAAVDRLVAAVIVILQRSEHQRVLVDHGLTRDSWLRAIARRTGGDAGMLLAAAERLADMPAVTAWFHQGVLSWGAVRAIVAATRNLTVAQRSWLDETLAADGERMCRLDGDQVVAAVDGLVARARPDLHADREASGLARRWLRIAPRLDGTADIHGTLDAETAATALAAFTTPSSPDRDGDAHDGQRNGRAGDGAATEGRSDLSDGDRVRAARRRSNVDIFKHLCEQRLTRHRGTDEPDSTNDVGDTGTHANSGHGHRADLVRDRDGSAGAGVCGRCGAAPSTARPAMLVVADVGALDPGAPTGSGTARLHWATNRAPVELTPQAAQRLACDATLRAVVTDGSRILGVTAAHPKVSATLRAALTVRDGGCRFPSCSQPAQLCDAHHVVAVGDGGPTTLANLALLCRDHHHAIHDARWVVTLHDDASMSFTRRGVTLASQPRAHQHPAPGRPPPGGRPRRHAIARPNGPPAHAARPGGQAAGSVGSRTITDAAGGLLPF